MMTQAERMDFLAFCSRYPITDEANFQIPQARMFATYLNAHRDPTKGSAALIEDFILGHPGIEVGERLLREWTDD